ncbi:MULTISPECIES: hypothetical protein [Natrialbaceae]|uniref:Uncharacterized protein n=2 Tax=Natrialbaceae TaxID=1644061 RepID=M0AFT9_NATA1|nr:MULTISPECIES: hypothetical protein [Natrialbaceae]ELY97404.1 hypothetical protein C481_20181 [Natrialba asiatica DSM 12278]QCS44499.1 hypothetical protein FEJ81_19440 [Natrinema versiforme]
MSSDVSSQSLLGLAGLASLCCIGPGTAAIAGGTSVGMIAGVVQGAVIFAVLGVIALLIRVRSNCSCSARDADREAQRSPSVERNADLE